LFFISRIKKSRNGGQAIWQNIFKEFNIDHITKGINDIRTEKENEKIKLEKKEQQLNAIREKN
jgi:hypothetical protein